MKAFPFKVVVGVILVILIITFFLLSRSAEHVSRNFVFILDQGRDYVFVKDIVVNHKLTLIGSEIGGGYAGFQGIFQGPAHFYFLSVFFLLFGGDPYGGVVYMGLFAIFALIAAVFLGKKLFGNILYGLLIALFITISPPLIAQAKFVWNPYPITVFLLLTFLFVFLSHTKHKKYLFLASFFAAFTYNFEIATTVPLLMALVLFYIFVLRLKRFKEYLTIVAGILAGLLPMLLFEIRHNFMAISGFFRYITSAGADTKEGYGLVNNYADRFLYNFSDTFPQQTVIPPLVVLFALGVLLVYFLIKEKKQELKHFLFFLLILIATTVFVLSFLRNHIFMYYLYHLNLVYIILVVYLVFALFRSKQYIGLGAMGLLVFLYLSVAFSHGMRDFKNDSSDVSAYQKVQAKIQAVDSIFQDAKGKPFGLFVFAPPVYTYPYDYLVWWRGENVFHYQPTQSKDGLFYLLIEKDTGRPWTYNGWIETVIKEGRVLETKTLPSGLIIQKRCGKDCPI